MNIRDKDLDLLPIFLGIGEELNLSRASARLHLSQPALSHALVRLREQFSDSLFVRSQRGLIATPRANALLPQVRALLVSAGKLYGPGERFDLATLRRKTVIASTAYYEALAVVPFIGRARKLAPGLEVETRSLGGGFPRQELESGEYDLAFAAYFDEAPAGFALRPVLTDCFVCVCSRKNRYLKSRRSLSDYLACEHLQIDVPPGVQAPAEQYLRSRGKRREITLRVGNFLTAPAVLAKSDLLLTCPRGLAEQYRTMFPLTITNLPFPLPDIETKVAWHQRNEQDPFHLWLRTELVPSA